MIRLNYWKLPKKPKERCTCPSNHGEDGLDQVGIAKALGSTLSVCTLCGKLVYSKDDDPEEQE